MPLTNNERLKVMFFANLQEEDLNESYQWDREPKDEL